MSSSDGRSRGQEINTWVQTGAILVAGLWYFGTFFYTNVWVPASAPINITLDLQLKKIGSDKEKFPAGGKQLIPIEIKISARNPSSRTVYLLPSAWQAFGFRIQSTSKPTPIHAEGLVAHEESDCKSDPLNLEMYAGSSEPDLVGVGRLFSDTSLRPNEVITRTLIIYVPPNKYDEISVDTWMPTVVKDRVVDLEWKLNEKQQLEATVYRRGPKGERKEMPRNACGGYSADPKIDLEQASSTSDLSLR